MPSMTFRSDMAVDFAAIFCACVCHFASKNVQSMMHASLTPLPLPLDLSRVKTGKFHGQERYQQKNLARQQHMQTMCSNSEKCYPPRPRPRIRSPNLPPPGFRLPRAMRIALPNTKICGQDNNFLVENQGIQGNLN